METLRDLIDGLVRWTGLLMPDANRARQLTGDLTTMQASIDPAAQLSTELVTAVERTCHRTARHLTLALHEEPGQPDLTAPGWPPVQSTEVADRAGNVRSVQRRGRSGLLRLDGFDEAQHAAPFLHAAFRLLRDCDTVVLDLRSNGGGALSSLALVAEFMLGPQPTHLATVHHRSRPPHQWWTAGSLGELTLAPEARVAVLIGPGTYSSGEALAYHLHHRGRVRTFGRRTPGAADHVTPIRVTPRVTALMPEATPVDPITGGNWERDGVPPDVDCDPGSAGSVAENWLRSAVVMAADQN
jgi:C-terminal processing protease CtpA/Prc